MRTALCLLLVSQASLAVVQDVPWVTVSADKKGFITVPDQRPFVPWGLNYDHDEQGRLLEDYWESDWGKVERDFRVMKALGANLVRVHLQLGKFLVSEMQVNEKSLEQLRKLLRLARDTGLYLDVTGLGCYHKAEVPPWYDALSEARRWEAQALFWRAVAECCAASPSVFCYDLMNEPVVPGGRRDGRDWLGPPFGGKHFVQFITLDQAGRSRPDVARRWIHHLVTAIREKDKRHLITVGMVDWSLDRPGLTSGFVPVQMVNDLDFLSVHLYPESGKVSQALDTLAGFAVGKPVLIEETFPLRCTPQELETFIDKSKRHAAGWVGFYWGHSLEALRQSKSVADAMTLGWLELFQRKAKAVSR